MSVENARWLRRLDVLYDVPAVVHFASFEPLLGDLGDITAYLPGLDWGIIGGESGPQRRLMDVAWLERLVVQCQAADVAVWVKQASAYRDGQQGSIPGALWRLKALPQPQRIAAEHRQLSLFSTGAERVLGSEGS